MKEQKQLAQDHIVNSQKWNASSGRPTPKMKLNPKE